MGRWGGEHRGKCVLGWSHVFCWRDRDNYSNYGYLNVSMLKLPASVGLVVSTEV